MTQKSIKATQLFAADNAPRVLTTQAISSLLARTDITMSSASITRFVGAMTDAGLFRRISQGLYLNMLSNPPAVADEAAGFIRNRAIVSLQRALGLYGVANNPSVIVTAVVPLSRDTATPRLGIVETDICLFQFRGIPAGLFAQLETFDIEQRFNRPIPGTASVATPERALVDWLYLAQTPRSDMAPPPAGDMDLGLLDLKRVRRLSVAYGIADYATEWLANATALQEHDWDLQANKMGLSI